jgi:LysR family nod box-dependent transcriptional activator
MADGARLHNLDLNLLVKLHALLDERSVSKAASRVFLSQPAMSEALARLREHFKDELLVKVGKTMAPTALAESLMPRVRDVLKQIQAITALTAEFNPGTCTRQIRIMASDYAVNVLLAKVITRVWQLAPNIRIEVLPLTSHFQEEMERGRLDLLIVPDIYIADDVHSELLFEDEIVCVVWSEGNMARKEMTMDQYLRAGHICVNLGEWRVPTYEAWYLKRVGEKERKIEVAVPRFGMALKFVPGTNRIATVHRRHAQMVARRYSLRILQPPFAIPPFREHILWPKHLDHDPALIWFRSQVKYAAAQLGAAV